MNNFKVCSLPEVPTLYPHFKPVNMISLTRNNVPMFPTVENYLRLAFDDFSHDSPATMAAGYQGPIPQHITAILAFARSVDLSKNTLIHCDAGVARSTAAFLIILTAQYGIDWVIDNYFQIVAVRPAMYPNKLMIKYADDQLECEDKLNKVCHAIMLDRPNLLREIYEPR